MLALTTALLTAAIALFGKLSFDIWGIHRERQGIAASLAGEIGAYVALLNLSVITVSLRTIAEISYDLRQEQLRLFTRLPNTHPVFDRVSDRIGILSVDIALEISKFYNVVSGLRILISDLSSERFLGLSDEHQRAALRAMANGIDEHIIPAKDLQDRLEVISHRKFRTFLLATKTMD